MEDQEVSYSMNEEASPEVTNVKSEQETRREIGNSTVMNTLQAINPEAFEVAEFQEEQVLILRGNQDLPEGTEQSERWSCLRHSLILMTEKDGMLVLPFSKETQTREQDLSSIFSAFRQNPDVDEEGTDISRSVGFTTRTNVKHTDVIHFPDISALMQKMIKDNDRGLADFIRSKGQQKKRRLFSR